MAHSPPRKEFSPLSKRDKRLPWNATWGKPLDKEGEGVTVKDGTFLSLGLTNSPPPESTSTKFRKKGLLKDTIGQPNSQMWLTRKGVLVHPVKAKRGIGKNASAGQWTRGMDCCWQTWNHWVLTTWKTQQQKLT